jgi:uncharacterized integral membrane protein (TIGR00697 family)
VNAAGADSRPSAVDGAEVGGVVHAMDRRDLLYLWLAGIFVASLIVADLIGGRFFRVGSVDLSVGLLAFPLTFVLTDVVNEFYGTTGAKRLTYLGLGASVFVFAVISVALAVPPSPIGVPNDTFRSVIGVSRRLFVASLAAYLIGQMADITVFAAFRRVTRHRLLWLRATGSTVISQVIDTSVVTFGLMVGQQPTGTILRVIVHSYLIKLVFAVGLTPLIYAVHALVLRVLRVGEPVDPRG